MAFIVFGVVMFLFGVGVGWYIIVPVPIPYEEPLVEHHPGVSKAARKLIINYLRDVPGAIRGISPSEAAEADRLALDKLQNRWQKLQKRLAQLKLEQLTAVMLDTIEGTLPPCGDKKL